jgi:hypothetical protein
VDALTDQTSALLPKLNQVFGLQRQIARLHPFLQDLFPIAVAKEAGFLVFVPEPERGTYRFLTREPAPMPVPDGVRAAFPLGSLSGGAACIVTEDAFDSQEGLVTVFHEFVHCRQWAGGEKALRGELALAKKAESEGDAMWEIAYPFPYDDEAIAGLYLQTAQALREKQDDQASALRQALRDRLSQHDWEYLTWQEWKEGFARLLENSMRAELGLALNTGGRTPPLRRVSFYAGGEALIARITTRDASVLTNLSELFAAVCTPEALLQGEHRR